MKVLRFPLVLNSRGLYYSVLVAASKKSMYKLYQRASKESYFKGFLKGTDLDFVALTCSWKDLKIRGYSQCVGCLLLCAPEVTPEIVSHEMVHVAMHWAERFQKVWKNPIRCTRTQERIADLVGKLVKQFWSKYRAQQRRKTFGSSQIFAP